MKKLLMLTALLMMSMVSHSQINPVDPSPRCGDLDLAGVIQTNGQNTQAFVGALDIQSEPTPCNGIWAYVGPGGSLAPGDFAYGIFDASLILDLDPTAADFTVDLSTVLVDLPVGSEVKIAELRGSMLQKAELRLKKIHKLSSKPKRRGQRASTAWKLTVKWNGPFTTVYTEDTFIFEPNETVRYNYVTDYSDPTARVELISFGGNNISVNPYTHADGGMVTLIEIGELVTYHLGLIESDVTIPELNGIEFDINWSIHPTE